MADEQKNQQKSAIPEEPATRSVGVEEANAVGGTHPRTAWRPREHISPVSPRDNPLSQPEGEGPVHGRHV